ncbi:hypothetical protein CBS147343_7860 [Aspergillus niger]|uniref:Uncharacterized protein n=2 Tax=Aspergillus subgen. Circumdati TaxID=2720871 RepID=A0A117E236_ASPNG|nr:hypothetical protein CBS12448_4896 [Aspergillus niger]GLA85267.1 hypothetical protein AtubIFM56815_009503 [Aspergillus tubingensis]KAI2921858.1 hypothetical protein CBS147371_2351 [Aspergillus niger]KAI2937115.1 hypothetical protein CBS147322_10975 [Aspergillus niger]KAI2943661.1 hypothetical protein CBS147321_4598 [Aspergillus niger]
MSSGTKRNKKNSQAEDDEGKGRSGNDQSQSKRVENRRDGQSKNDEKSKEGLGNANDKGKGRQNDGDGYGEDGQNGQDDGDGNSEHGQNSQNNGDGNGEHGQNSQNDGDEKGEEDEDDTRGEPMEVDEEEVPLTLYKKPKVRDWGRELKQNFINKNDATFKEQFQEEEPNFDIIENAINVFNRSLRKENQDHHEKLDRATIQASFHRPQWAGFKASISLRSDARAKWTAFDKMRFIVVQFNTQNELPQEWNFSREIAKRILGERPVDMDEPDETYKEPGVDIEDDTETDSDSDSDSEEDGLGQLENRMMEHFSALYRGRVVCWWATGSFGTQILVRYRKREGKAKHDIYRVRAGSSQTWNPQRVVQIFPDSTRGQLKVTRVVNGLERRQWQWGRKDVKDILGVGWSVGDEEEGYGDCYRELHPKVERERYRDTVVIVRWKDKEETIETRQFVRRMAIGGPKKGDMLIYTKAREMETAYWGQDPEIEESNSDFITDDSYTSDESHTGQAARSGKNEKQRKHKKAENRATYEESTNNPYSSDEPHLRRSSRLSKKHKKHREEKSTDVDREIRRLEKELKKLKLKKRR